MIKNFAQEMGFDDFKDLLTLEMINELAEKNISINLAYSIFQNNLSESDKDDFDDVGTMDDIFKGIIIEYTEELLANEYDQYEILK